MHGTKYFYAYDIEFIYDGQNHLPTATLNVDDIVNGDECRVTVTGEQTNAGTYEATATNLSNGNYKLPTNVVTSFVINKGENLITQSLTSL